MSGTQLRTWRKGKGYSLDEVCDLIAHQGVDRPSIAKLSRIERDQQIPVELIPALAAITEIPPRELRPDIARIFDGGAQ